MICSPRELFVILATKLCAWLNTENNRIVSLETAILFCNFKILILHFRDKLFGLKKNEILTKLPRILKKAEFSKLYSYPYLIRKRGLPISYFSKISSKHKHF